MEYGVEIKINKKTVFKKQLYKLFPQRMTAEEAIERNIKFATTKRPISTTIILPKLTGRRFQKERSMLVQKLS